MFLHRRVTATKWSLSVVSNSLQPHGLQPTRLLRPWNFPGKSTGVGCHFLLQRTFLTQGSKPGLPHCRQMLTIWATRESPQSLVGFLINLFLAVLGVSCNTQVSRVVASGGCSLVVVHGLLTVLATLVAPLVAQLVKNPPATQETSVWFLGRKDPLEKG